MKRLGTLALGIALGVGGVALTAACLPEGPPPVVDHEETDPPPRESKPPITEGPLDRLNCGTALPVIDHNEVDGWWAYCEPATAGLTPHYLLPCAVEDSSLDCYWDATVRGNKAGTSFVHIDGVYYYPEG
jgi:hypothetical protein